MSVEIKEIEKDRTYTVNGKPIYRDMESNWIAPDGLSTVELQAFEKHTNGTHGIALITVKRFKECVWYPLAKYPLAQEDFNKVIGFSPEWIDEDFNPDGTRECFINYDLGWTSARWDDPQDCYIEDYDSPPTHFMILPSTKALK